MKRFLRLFLFALSWKKLLMRFIQRKANFVRVSKFTFGIDLQGNHSFSFPMAVASYHGICSSKVKLSIGYFQPILWPCTHQPEMRCVPIVIGLQNRIIMYEHAGLKITSIASSKFNWTECCMFTVSELNVHSVLICFIHVNFITNCVHIWLQVLNYCESEI